MFDNIRHYLLYKTWLNKYDVIDYLWYGLLNETWLNNNHTSQASEARNRLPSLISSFKINPLHVIYFHNLYASLLNLSRMIFSSEASSNNQF